MMLHVTGKDFTSKVSFYNSITAKKMANHMVMLLSKGLFALLIAGISIYLFYPQD